MKKKYFCFLFLLHTSLFAMDLPLVDAHIPDQNIDLYVDTKSPDFDARLLTPDEQQQQVQQFYRHYYASDADALSPWSDAFITSVLPVIQIKERLYLSQLQVNFLPTPQKHYGLNFKEHDAAWVNQLEKQMNFEALEHVTLHPEHKAITIRNTLVRQLPTHEPDFFHVSLPGEGYPFDTLQSSALWAGTPLYVISLSKDGAWSLVLTPDLYFAWIPSDDLAYASAAFIQTWQTAARTKLMAITQTQVSVFDLYKNFQFSSYIGAVFPLMHQDDQSTSIMIPVKNKNNQADITEGVIATDAVHAMPWTASKKNILTIIEQLKHRPYGWGGMLFFNDCSQELKSIFTPFGLWLPRNSLQQSRLEPHVDLSSQPMKIRLDELKTQGHPFMTLIYIGGHVMLYLGQHVWDQQGMVAMTYQNLWGLSPKDKSVRYVMGQSLFFPLLTSYLELPEVLSPADKDQFVWVYLDQLKPMTWTDVHHSFYD